MTKPVSKGAQTSIHCCYDKELQSGKYYKDCRVTPTAVYANVSENIYSFIEYAREQIKKYGISSGCRFDIEVKKNK